jgi:hypothetical protein
VYRVSGGSCATLCPAATLVRGPLRGSCQKLSAFVSDFDSAFVAGFLSGFLSERGLSPAYR